MFCHQPSHPQVNACEQPLGQKEPRRGQEGQSPGPWTAAHCPLMPRLTSGNSLCSGVCWSTGVHGKTALWASFQHPALPWQILAISCHRASVEQTLEGTSHGAPHLKAGL